MLIKIVEPDTKYIKQFSDYLISRGAKVSGDAAVLEVPETFNCDNFHGVVIFDTEFQSDIAAAGKFLSEYNGTFELFHSLKKHLQSNGSLSEKQLAVVKNAISRETSPSNFLADNADVINWLNNYRGDFPFYVSLQMQFRTKATLSPKQIDAVRKAIARESGTVSAEAQTSFTLKVGEVIRVAKWLGQKVAFAAGLVRPHYVMEVVKILSETEKAYQAVLRLSAQRTSHCCICGTKLTNAKSVTAGIGPICGSFYDISFSEKSLGELREKLLVTKEVTTWFPKVAIRERYGVK